MGATGYIGGRLVPELADAGHEIRCLTRRPEKLAGVPWAERVEVVEGDALDPASLTEALADVEVVYYLVHSIGSGGHFEDTDREAANNVAAAAKAAGTERIVYLGGLVPGAEETASAHLASRAEVGQIFLDSGVPTVVLQAGVIIGSGSASFEMLRYLTERLAGDGHSDAGCRPGCSPSPCATCSPTSSVSSTCPTARTGASTSAARTS